jgi:hypothetical protein
MNFSTIASPLYELTKKNAKFEWKEQHEQAFETLKMRFATAPILSIYRQDCPIIVDNDASDTGIGAIISQIVDGQELLVLVHRQ